MIKNFETVKAQLSELSSVINLFKSEAVQLRIIELVLGVSQTTNPTDEGGAASATDKKASRLQKTQSVDGERKKDSKKKKVVAGTGAVSALTELASTTFFDKPRTINDIIEHCKHKLARSFKANEFSGKLGRMVRNEELTRQKNAEKQYEYKKK